MKKTLILFMILFACLNMSVSLAEPVPATINYQGYLANSFGMPMPDGLYPITFRIFGEESEGDALWTETWQGENRITLTNGRFHIELGKVLPFNDVALNFSEQYYLEIDVDGHGILEPRIKLTSAPYAQRAANITAMNSMAGSVVGTDDVQTMTEKTLSGPAIQNGSIDQAVIGETAPAGGRFTDLTSTGNLTVDGKILTRIKIEGAEKTTNYTLLNSDEIILVNAAGGMVIVTFPSAAGQAGKTYTVLLTAVDGDPGTTDLLIATSNGETINGVATLLMNRENQSVQVISDGVNWQAREETGGVMAAYMDTYETTLAPPGSHPMTQYVFSSDTIIDGSECIGTDCVNGEVFGADILRLKENNLRILFDDTSDSAFFPGNDWRLTANDSNNGGRNYFSIDDVDGAISGVTLEKGGNLNIGYNDVEPEGRLQVHVLQNNAGSVTTINRPFARTGTITRAGDFNLGGTGQIYTTGTTVDGTWDTVFTTEFKVGFIIVSAGEEKTITAIESNNLLSVDSAWSSDLVNQPFTIKVTLITGTDTQFTSELNARAHIVVDGETKKIHRIDSDTALYTNFGWVAPFTDVPLVTTIPILSGTGTFFATGEANIGDVIVVSDQVKQILAINSDVDIQVDSFFSTDFNDASYEIIKTEFIVTEDGKAGVGTSTPDEGFEVEFKVDTDVEIAQGDSSPGQSVISLRSPDGSKFFINVDNSGNLSGTSVKP